MRIFPLLIIFENILMAIYYFNIWTTKMNVIILLISDSSINQVGDHSENVVNYIHRYIDIDLIISLGGVP